MVDLTFLEKFTKGNTTKMKRYISMYLDGTPKLFEDMENHLKEENWEQLRISAHSLKPQAELIGIPSLKESLIKIENAVKENSFQLINEVFQEALEINYASQKQLQEHLENISN